MARPIKSLNEIIGHKSIVSYLTKCLNKDNVPDVIILSGNSGLGKSSIAKLLAIGINANTGLSKDKVDSLIDTVVNKNESTDCIKMINMSSLNDETVRNIKDEITVGFSSTGRKVLILDEAHGMSKKVQDSILIELEPLPTGVFIILCTTELSSIRDAIQSRAKISLRLNPLSRSDMYKLIKSEIEYRKLKFDVNQSMVINMLIDYCKNQPRNAYNLLESFEIGSLVSSDDLSMFINLDIVDVTIKLLEYLYSSMSLGIDFISGMTLDSNITTGLVEVTKVVLGKNSVYVSGNQVRKIQGIVQNKDVGSWLSFVSSVTGAIEMSRRVLFSAFISNAIEYNMLTKGSSKETTKAYDIGVIANTVDKSHTFSRPTEQGSSLSVPTIEDMFNNSYSVK